MTTMSDHLIRRLRGNGSAKYLCGLAADEIERLVALLEQSRRAAQPAALPSFDMDAAPKDRELMLFARGCWHLGRWDHDRYAQKPRPFWSYSYIWRATGCRAVQPIAWMLVPAAPCALNPSTTGKDPA